MVKLCVYKPCRPGVTWPCFDRNLARQHEPSESLLFYVVTDDDDDGCSSRRDSLRVRLATTRSSLEFADGAIALTVILGALVALGGPFFLVSLIDYPRDPRDRRRAVAPRVPPSDREVDRASLVSDTRGRVSFGMRIRLS